MLIYLKIRKVIDLKKITTAHPEMSNWPISGWALTKHRGGCGSGNHFNG
jgi:hypothetical protein